LEQRNQKNKLEYPSEMQNLSLLEMAPLPNDPYCWAYELLRFFEIREMYDIEKQSAIKIQHFLKNLKKILLKKKFQIMALRMKSMVTNICLLPNHILVKVFEFFDKRERLIYQQLNKQMKAVAESPYLW
jgi:hypothetical protein